MNKLTIYTIYVILGAFVISVLPFFAGVALFIGGGIMLEKLEIENIFVHVLTYLILIFIAFKFALWWGPT